MNNPYGSYLGDREPIGVLSTTVDRIATLTNGLRAEQLAVPTAPGKWSVHEIVAHLADLDLVTSARCRWTLFEDNPTLIGYDQDPWIAGWRKEKEPFPETFERFRVLRQSLLRLLRNCSPQDFARPATHTDHGAINLGFFPPLLAGHDLNHLQQLERFFQR